MMVLKNVLLFGAVFLAFGFNMYLKAEGVGLFVRSAPDADPWYTQCYYYAPVRIITVTKPVQFGCSPVEHFA